MRNAAMAANEGGRPAIVAQNHHWIIAGTLFFGVVGSGKQFDDLARAAVLLTVVCATVAPC